MASRWLSRGDSVVSEDILYVQEREKNIQDDVYYDHAPSGGEVLWDWVNQEGLDDTAK